MMLKTNLRRLVVIILTTVLAASRAGTLPYYGVSSTNSMFISVNNSAPGLTIPLDFLGMSGEVGDFSGGAYQGTTGLSGSYISLVSLLGSHGVIRLGGGSSDNGTAPTITPAMASNLAGFLGGLGWTLIYGLDAVANNPSAASSTASTIASAVGSANVTFQFGNEPSQNFTPASYETMWNSYYTAVSSAVAGAKVAAVDDVINTIWGSVPTVISALTPGISGMSLVTQHFYSFCSNQFAGPIPSILVSSAINDAAVGSYVNKGAGYLVNINAYGSVPQRMSETNSICGGGQNGFSNTLVATTWFLNLASILASHGWAGLNVHNANLIGTTSAYNPVVYVPGDAKFTAGPIFYSMFLFSKITGQQILPSAMTGWPGNNANIVALATKNGAKSNILVVNNDVTNSVVITTDQGSASVLQIKSGSGAGCSDTSVTIGGQPIGESGAWSGAPFAVSPVTFTLGPCESALSQGQ